MNEIPCFAVKENAPVCYLRKSHLHSYDPQTADDRTPEGPAAGAEDGPASSCPVSLSSSLCSEPYQRRNPPHPARTRVPITAKPQATIRHQSKNPAIQSAVVPPALQFRLRLRMFEPEPSVACSCCCSSRTKTGKEG